MHFLAQDFVLPLTNLCIIEKIAGMCSDGGGNGLKVPINKWFCRPLRLSSSSFFLSVICLFFCL